jgi:L-ribulokinase
MPHPVTLGLDFGTNSVRAVVVHCNDGSTIGTAVSDNESGDHGVQLDPKEHHHARQNPPD